jgi:diadenosine tetraphosphate (Ap4A) HIT family hydrolase
VASVIWTGTRTSRSFFAVTRSCSCRTRKSKERCAAEATFALLKLVKEWMDERYHPDGYNVGWNCGEAGGQIAMHAHMHVIPRFRQEPYAGRGIRYWLKQTANRW